MTSLPDGTLTFSVSLTNVAGNVGSVKTATSVLNRNVPNGYTVTPDQNPINLDEVTTVGFTIANGAAGDT